MATDVAPPANPESQVGSPPKPEAVTTPTPAQVETAPSQQNQGIFQKAIGAIEQSVGSTQVGKAILGGFGIDVPASPPAPGTPPKPGQLPEMGKPIGAPTEKEIPFGNEGAKVVNEKLPGGWEAKKVIIGKDQNPDQEDLVKKDDKGNVVESYHMKKDWGDGSTKIEHTKDGKTSIEITNQNGEVTGEGVSEPGKTVISKKEEDGKIRTDFDDKRGGTTGWRIDNPKDGTFKQRTYFGSAILDSSGGGGQPEKGTLTIDGKDPIPVEKKDGKFVGVRQDGTTYDLPRMHTTDNPDGEYQAPEVKPLQVEAGAAQKIVDTSSGYPAQERIVTPPKSGATPNPPAEAVQQPAPLVDPKGDVQKDPPPDPNKTTVKDGDFTTVTEKKDPHHTVVTVTDSSGQVVKSDDTKTDDKGNVIEQHLSKRDTALGAWTEQDTKDGVTITRKYEGDKGKKGLIKSEEIDGRDGGRTVTDYGPDGKPLHTEKVGGLGQSGDVYNKKDGSFQRTYMRGGNVEIKRDANGIPTSAKVDDDAKGTSSVYDYDAQSGKWIDHQTKKPVEGSGPDNPDGHHKIDPIPTADKLVELDARLKALLERAKTKVGQ